MSTSAKLDLAASDWLARRDRHDWSDRDQAELELWLNSAIAHRIAYLRLQATWQRADRLAELPAQVAVIKQGQRPSFPRFSQWRIAASVLLAACGAAGVWLHNADSNKAQYQTAIGARDTVALADGTQVLLNTDTRIQVRLEGQSRRVWLDQGEVFLDVAHDPTKPFTVNVGNRVVTVLGTKFSLRRDGDALWVKVLEGRVQVQTRGVLAAAPATVVTGNSVALVQADEVSVSNRSPQQISDELSWREGKLTLSNLTLGEAARQFNRYNTRKLVVADPATEAIVIGGRFDASNVEGFARLVQGGFGLTVTEDTDKIIISGKRSGF